MKLKTKQMILIIVLIIIPISAGIIYTYFNIQSSIKKIEISKAKKDLHSTKNFINSYIENQKKDLTLHSPSTEICKAMYRHDLSWIEENVFNNYAKEGTSSEAVALLSDTGTMIDAKNIPYDWTSINGDISEVNTVSKVIKGNKYLSGGLEKTSDGIQIVSAIKMTTGDDRNYKQHKGYLVFVRKLTKSIINEGKKLIGVDIGIYLNKSNFITTSNEMKKDNTNLKAYKGENIIISYRIDHRYMIIDCSQLIYDSSNKPIGVLKISTRSTSGVTALNKLLINSIILIILALLLSIVILNWLNENVIKPITDMSSILEEKDLSRNLEINTNDEISELAQNFDSMMMEIKELLLRIKRTSDDVNLKSSTIVSVSDSIVMTTKEVTSSMYQVAQGVDAQAKDFMDIEHSFTKFGLGISNMTNEIGEVQEGTEKIDKMCIDGNEKLEQLSISIDEIGILFGEMKNNINGLGGNIVKISDITNLINSVAEQTELLSINAAIEAAKAGEAGKGFSVVSQEIKKLALQTKESSHTIDEMVQEISIKNRNVISTTEFVSDKFKKQISTVNSSVKSFKNIIEAINFITPKISSIDDSIKDVNDEKSNILCRVESVTAVAEQISATTSEVASSTEEMYHACVEVEAVAKDLDKTVDVLMEEFQKFKLT